MNVLIVVHKTPIDPIGAMQLYAAGRGCATQRVVFADSIHSAEMRSELLSGVHYDVVAFSTITGSHLQHNEIAAAFHRKSPDTRTIMGGPHPTFFPQEALSLSDIDDICIGEGYRAWQWYLRGQPIKSGNLYGKNSRPIGSRAPLDFLMHADDLQEHRGDFYRAMGTERRVAIRNFMGVYGCPNSCTYCYSYQYRKMYGAGSLRMRTPSKYVDDIAQTIQMYPASMVFFQEDTFISDFAWFQEVTDRYAAVRNRPKYHCQIRCDKMDGRVVAQLKKTGCHSVTFAIETADDEYRTSMLNRRMSNEQILSAAARLREAGIGLRTENMVGLPAHGLRRDLETMRLNAKCRPTIGWASLFQPYPGTKLGESCRSLGLWGGDVNSISSTFFAGSILKIPNRRETERLQRLFGLGVSNSVVRFLMPLLIRLPLDFIYRGIYSLFKKRGYSSLFILGGHRDSK